MLVKIVDDLVIQCARNMNVGDGLSNRVEHQNRIKAQIIVFEKLIDTFGWIYLKITKVNLYIQKRLTLLDKVAN